MHDFHLTANTVLGWELRDVWAIGPKQSSLETGLGVPRDRSWRAEKSSNRVEEGRFVRFPDRFGTDSSAIITWSKRWCTTAISESEPTPSTAR
jgi:hypothetical protein